MKINFIKIKHNIIISNKMATQGRRGLGEGVVWKMEKHFTKHF